MGSSRVQYLRRLLRWLRKWQHLPGFRKNGGTDSGAAAVLDIQRPKPDFVYRPLERPDQIRVLELLPSTGRDGLIQCKLLHTGLRADQYPYTALSYVWGDPKLPKKTIECDGGVALVTPSLHSALTRARSRDHTVLLWADALCIDQRETNNKEKPQQVAMMDKIYATAQEVLVDLGLIAEDLKGVLPTLDQYAAISAQTWSAIVSSPNTPAALALLQKEIVPDSKSDFWTLFPRFLQRPWFTRVWVIQEHALAKTVRFMIGDEFRDGAFLQDAIVRAALHMSWLYKRGRYHAPDFEAASRLSGGLYAVADTINAIQRIVELRGRSANRYSFCELLSMSTVLFQATKIKDRAYALMGLAADAHLKRDLAVDYDQADSALMLNVSRYLCRAGFAIYPLYHCVGDRKDHRSWALNLGDTTKDDLALLIVASGKTQPPLYNACGSGETYKCMFSQIRPGGLLIGACMCLDTVDQTMKSSLPPRLSLTAAKPAASHSGWLDEAFEWMCCAAQSLNLGGADKDTFVTQGWRTLLADTMTDTNNESRGPVRTRDAPASERCLATWSKQYSRQYLKRQSGSTSVPEDSLTEDEYKLTRLYGESLGFAFGRRLGVTHKRRLMCLLPASAEVGDHIVLVQGCQIPFVFRRCTDEKGEYFRIVGCVYVHDIMDGELVHQEGWKTQDLEVW